MALNDYAESPLFSAEERTILEYADAITTTGRDVSDELFARVRALYDEETANEQHSRVTWEIEPQDRGVTKLVVVHDALEGAPKTAASVAGGWMYILSGLKTLLETGRPLAD